MPPIPGERAKFLVPKRILNNTDTRIEKHIFSYTKCPEALMFKRLIGPYKIYVEQLLLYITYTYQILSCLLYTLMKSHFQQSGSGP